MTQAQKDKFKNHNQRRNSITKNRNSFLNIGVLLTLISLVIVGSSISYVLVKNDLSIKGFVINDLQKKVNYLNDKHDKLELRLTSIQSYKNLAMRVEDLGMVKSDKINYINSNEDHVAMR